MNGNLAHGGQDLVSSMLFLNQNGLSLLCSLFCSHICICVLLHPHEDAPARSIEILLTDLKVHTKELSAVDVTCRRMAGLEDMLDGTMNVASTKVPQTHEFEDGERRGPSSLHPSVLPERAWIGMACACNPQELTK